MPGDLDSYNADTGEGEFYKEALALLIEIEKGLEELEFSPEKTCGKERQYSGCWIVTQAVAR